MRNVSKQDIDSEFFYVRLAGDLPALAEYELSSLFSTYGVTFNPFDRFRHYLFFRSNVSKELIKKIFIRSGLCFEIGYLAKDMNDTNKALFNKDITVWEEGGISEWSRNNFNMASSIREQYLHDRPIFRIIKRNNEYIAYCVISSYKFKNANIHGRYIIDAPVVLPYRLNKLLINLSMIKEGDTVLDVFAGTGRLLIEAALMGIKGIGIDIDLRRIKESIANINYNNVSDMIDITQHDAMRCNEIKRSINGIATDPPYGRSSTLNHIALELLYRKTLSAMADTISKGKKVSFIFPNEGLIDLAKDYLKVNNVFPSRVHRSLTRYFVQLEK
ncbi:MAG: RsmD family RNA methyltransferase [Candidatus Thermoplasmatota archaeon]|nr:RsmD family RNA methyltransferase [Candidatus Thermoplasmatota archaeon]MCL5962816.1 RsmD family RNA methyltransferase [Candidatus Thermoplasmatota archaeon]